MPLNFTIGGREIPFGLLVTTLVLGSVAIVNLFTKQLATKYGLAFTLVLFVVFVLFVRGGTCTGQCPADDLDIARTIFIDKTDEVALDSLALAVAGGGAWRLAGSDLAIRKGSASDPDLPSLTVQRNVRGTVDGQPLSIPTLRA